MKHINSDKVLGVTSGSAVHNEPALIIKKKNWTMHYAWKVESLLHSKETVVTKGINMDGSWIATRTNERNWTTVSTRLRISVAQYWTMHSAFHSLPSVEQYGRTVTQIQFLAADGRYVLGKTLPAFPWKNWGQQRKFSVAKAGNSYEAKAVGRFPNTIGDRQSLANSIGE
jgi:hypothetical protein